MGLILVGNASYDDASAVDNKLSLSANHPTRASLEQIFNDFAALQEEETGPVQGGPRDKRFARLEYFCRSEQRGLQ